MTWPNDAERKASLLRVGMSIVEVANVLGPQGAQDPNDYHPEIPVPVVGSSVVGLLCSPFGQGSFLAAAVFVHGRTEVPVHLGTARRLSRIRYVPVARRLIPVL
jgi:hypothetical protein